MENLRAKFMSTALGASGSMTGLLSLSQCSGGACTACLGCAGAGMGILLLLLFNRVKGNNKEEGNGVA